MIRRFQAHHHPDLNGPCVVDEDPWAAPSLHWPAWLTVLFLAVGLVVGGYLLWLAVTAL